MSISLVFIQLGGAHGEPMTDAQQLADRYVAVWNETDPAARREQIAALWAPDGEHYVRTLEVRGHAALEQRVIGSYEKNVRDAGHRFRARANAQVLRNVVTFHWEMVAGAAVVAVGHEVLVLDDRGRIATNYQFIDA
jgi:hypothetical protein